MKKSALKSMFAFLLYHNWFVLYFSCVFFIRLVILFHYLLSDKFLYCYLYTLPWQESENAIKELNGVKLDSKKIIVDWARKQQTTNEQVSSRFAVIKIHCQLGV